VTSIKFDPATRGMLAIAQLVVPLATPLAPFATFSHTTRVTTDGAVPVMLMLDCVVVKDVPDVGVQICTVDAVAHPLPVDDVVLELVTSSLSILGFPAASYPVIWIKFDPATRGMLAVAQLVVPLATPLAPFAAFSHTTRVTTDGAVPVRLMLDCVVE
jgi:hypothetical protein